MWDFIDDIDEAINSPLKVKKLWLINSDVYPEFNKSPIHSLPNEFDQFKNLESLRIECHPIEYLPESITKIKSLTSINIYNTQLKGLPSKITDMYQLKFLGLRGNEIKEIPNDIGKLKNLESLFLEGNNLTSLPKSLYKLKKLKSLNVNYNNFDSAALKKIKYELAKKFFIVNKDSKPVREIWSEKFPPTEWRYEPDIDFTSVSLIKRKKGENAIRSREYSCSVCGATYGEGCLLSDFQNCPKK
jgi:Leucine-rich repeat (LRR) protein